jgi:hypothetical protein
VAWLKKDFKLGHGHASAIAHLLVHLDKGNVSPGDKLDALFTGNKVKWRKAYDALAAKVGKFGGDVELSPNRTYVNVLRGKKFAILQPSTGRRERGPADARRTGFRPSLNFRTRSGHTAGVILSGVGHCEFQVPSDWHQRPWFFGRNSESGALP